MQSILCTNSTCARCAESPHQIKLVRSFPNNFRSSPMIKLRGIFGLISLSIDSMMMLMGMMMLIEGKSSGFGWHVERYWTLGALTIPLQSRLFPNAFYQHSQWQWDELQSMQTISCSLEKIVVLAYWSIGVTDKYELKIFILFPYQFWWKPR